MNNQEFQLIEDYLLERLGDNERNEVNQKILSNQDFAKNVETVKRQIEYIEIQNFKESLNEVHHEVTSSKKKIFRLQPWIFIAASIFLLAIIMTFILVPWQSKNEALFTKHFEPTQGLPTFMGATNHPDFMKGMAEYKEENYFLAIEKWEKIDTEYQSNDTLNYYLGISYLANNQTENATDKFSKVIQTGKSNFNKNAYYYLALIYLKNNDIDKAIAYAQMSDYKEKEELIKKLQAMK